MIPRSYLYVPGDSEQKLAGAGDRGADAVIVDLEDAVPAAGKQAARSRVRTALTTAGPRLAGDQLWIRLNPSPSMMEVDLAEVATSAVAGFVVAKAEPELLTEADQLLTAAEQRLGVAPASFAVIALIETARGLLAAAQVAAAPRVVRLGLGEADLTAELGMRPEPDGAALGALRLPVVLASAAAGLARPIGPAETDLTAGPGLRSTTRALAALGFRARTALHPRQLPVINEAFTPSAAELTQARETLDALAAAQAGGAGVASTATGQFVDAAVARSAHETLMRHNDGA